MADPNWLQWKQAFIHAKGRRPDEEDTWQGGREFGRHDTVGVQWANGYARDRAIMAAVLEAHGDCPHSTGTSNWAHWVGSRVADALEKSHG